MVRQVDHQLLDLLAALYKTIKPPFSTLNKREYWYIKFRCEKERKKEKEKLVDEKIFWRHCFRSLVAVGREGVRCPPYCGTTYERQSPYLSFRWLYTFSWLKKKLIHSLADIIFLSPASGTAIRTRDLLHYSHVAVVSNIVGGGGGGAVTNVVRTCSPTPLLLFEQLNVFKLNYSRAPSNRRFLLHWRQWRLHNF